MDFTEDGTSIESYYPKIPYSLGMGAWFDEGEYRYTYKEYCFQNKPFDDLKSEITELLEMNHRVIKKWTRSGLFENGKKSVLP